MCFLSNSVVPSVADVLISTGNAVGMGGMAPLAAGRESTVSSLTSGTSSANKETPAKTTPMTSTMNAAFSGSAGVAYCLGQP